MTVVSLSRISEHFPFFPSTPTVCVQNFSKVSHNTKQHLILISPGTEASGCSTKWRIPSATRRIWYQVLLSWDIIWIHRGWNLSIGNKFWSFSHFPDYEASEDCWPAQLGPEVTVIWFLRSHISTSCSSLSSNSSSSVHQLSQKSFCRTSAYAFPYCRYPPLGWAMFCIWNIIKNIASLREHLL